MILYLTEQGLKVTKQSARLELWLSDNRVCEIRLAELDQVVVFGRIKFSPAVLQTLLTKEIEIHFLTLSGRYLGRLSSPKGKNVELRLEQYRHFEDPKSRLELAKSFVLGKIASQRYFLRRQNKRLKDPRLEEAILKLRKKIQEAKNAKDIEALRGIEGQAAAFYFDVFGRLFKVKGLEFRGRIRRPPTDPINALLSLGYTLLFSQMYGMAETSGLDPYVGFLHAPEYGRPSLVLDLMEEWRPIIVDTLVVRLFNWGTINPQDFTREVAPDEKDLDIPEEFLPLRLTQDGLRKFLVQFQKRLSEEASYSPLKKRFRYRDIIQHQMWHLASVLKNRKDHYQPFSLL